MIDRIEMIQVRLKCDDGDRGSLEVKSTFDRTERMEHRTDETVSFTDRDLVIIKNRRESPCEILLETVRLRPGTRLVCRPSRASAFTLTHRQASEIAYSRKIRLGGGESLVMQSSSWHPSAARSHYHGTV